MQALYHILAYVVRGSLVGKTRSAVMSEDPIPNQRGSWLNRNTSLMLMTTISVFAASHTWAAPCGLPAPDQVIIYVGTDRGGLCQVRRAGYYPNPSSFGLPNDSISSIDVGSKVRAALYEDPEFRGRQAHYEGGSYYTLGGDNNRASSIEIFPMQTGPAATFYLGNYPSSRKTFWSEEAQGLANDGVRWFVTKKERIFQVPLRISLDRYDGAGLVRAGIPPALQRRGYNHFGDLDQSSGFLFVPLEADEENSKPHVAVFRAEDLRFLSSFELRDSPDRSAPWLAIYQNRTLWVSSSGLSDGNQIREYVIDWERLRTSGQLVLTFRRQVTLKDRQGRTAHLTSMQGGVFNPEGTLLYLSTGPCHNIFEHGYVYVFALERATNTAYLQARSENGYGPFNFENHLRTTFGYCSGDEGEGLDWLDVRGLNVPGIPDGQLHLVIIDNDQYKDKVWLKHYSY